MPSGFFLKKKPPNRKRSSRSIVRNRESTTTRYRTIANLAGRLETSVRFSWKRDTGPTAKGDDNYVLCFVRGCD